MADYSDLGFTPAPAPTPSYDDLGFTPAEGAGPDVHQQAQGAVSKFLGEVWSQTGGSIGPTIKRVTGWDDWMKIRDQMKGGDYSGAGETLGNMINDPGHMAGDILSTSKDQLSRAANSFKAVKDAKSPAEAAQAVHRAAGHLNAAIPLVGTAFAGGMNGLDKMAAGDHAEGAADVVANLGMLALPGAVEEAAGRAAPRISAGLKRAAPVVKAAVEAGSPDIAMGALKVGAGAAMDAAGVPAHVGTFMGAREGVPQIARGVAKGFKAGRQVVTERAIPPALPEAAPIASKPPAVPPYFAEGSTQDPAASAQTTPQTVPEGPVAASTVSKYADLGFVPQEVETSLPAQPDTNVPEVRTPASQTETIAPPEATPAAQTETVAQPMLLDEPAYEHANEPAPGQKPDYQAAARTVKGRGMARFLANPPEGPAITAEEATRMTPDQWQVIAREAGHAAKKPPSPETIQIALDHMKEIEGRRAQRALPNATGSSTEDTGAQTAPAATLPTDGQGSTTGEPVQAPDQGAGNQGVSVQAAATPGSGPSAGATEVEIPGEGRSIPASYRLRELADIQSSHNGLTFQPNPKYTLANERDYTKSVNQRKVLEGSGDKFKPTFHITDNPDAVNGPPILDSKGNAVGGNGRTMQLQRVYAYNPKGAQGYRDLLSKKAVQFGIDPAEVAKMKQPVLVREIGEEHLGSASRAIADLNKTGTAALTPAERAIADSRRVSPATLDHIAAKLDAAGPDASLTKILSGDDGPAIVKRLIDDGVLTQQETAAYITDDHKLTPAAKVRVGKLMLGRFFRDPAQLDTTPAPILAKLERLAAPVAKLEGQGAWNLTPRLQEALDLIDEARAHSTRNLSEFLKQTGLLGESRYTEDAVVLGKALQRFTGRQLGQAVKDYAATARYAAEHADAKAGLFGADVKGEAPSPQKAFEAAFRPGKQSPSVNPGMPTNPAAPTKGKTTAEKLGDQLKND